MQEFLNYGFSGLTSAAIYAIAASGLVLTYTTTGVFNFAHGAMGMVAAFAYWEMRFGWHWPAPIALAVCILILAPAFGALLEVAIMRRLEGTSETTRLVVTLSLLLALFGMALWIWDPNRARPMNKFWEGRVVTVLHVRLPYHQVAALLIAAAVAAGLRLLLYRTRIGVSMRACVDDRSLAMLNGARPASTAMISWAIGSSLAALAGVLIAPTLTLSALPLTLLIIDAYAAAMIGRLRSLPMTFVGALILGMANDYGLGYLSRVTVGQQYIQGFLVSVPIIMLFVVLLVLPGARLRGHRSLRTREIAPLPTWPGTVGFCAAVIAGTIMLGQVVSTADLANLDRIWGIAIIGLSLIPLVGFAGQISLCQLSFAGIGMVVMAHAGGHGNPLALALAALITGLVGAVIALPALRLSGIYLALSTAAFAVLMDRWIFVLPRFTIFGHRFDLFQAGSLDVQRPRIGGLRVEGFRAYFIFGAVAFSVLSMLVVAIRRSAFGQRLLAMKDSPAAVATLGLNTTFAKMAVFAVSAAMAGFGGALYGGALRAVDPTSLDFFAGLTIIMLMVIAGINSIGAALFTGLFVGAPILQNIFPSLRQLQTVSVGFAGIGLGKNPNGFIPANIRPQWDVMLGEPAAIAGVVGSLIGLWVLRLTHVLGNWTYAFITLAVLVVAPLPARVLHARRTRDIAAAAVVERPLEWVGIGEPILPEDIAALDERLALSGFLEMGDGRA
jgi:branched-subunit amino acid ABC-type transport system permease component